METLFKFAVTALFLCVIYFQLLFLRGLWKSQIDPQATVARLVEKLKPKSDLIATRESTKFYQGGKPVADVIGEVAAQDGKILFRVLGSTGTFNRSQPFEYQRLTLRVASIGAESGMYVDKNEAGTVVATDVLEDVLCEVVKKR